MKIIFYDTKPYDRESFAQHNQEFGFKLKFLKDKLTSESVDLARGYDVVCAFVNDTLDREVIDGLVEAGVKLVALRCAGYNNVDLSYAKDKLRIVRVPAYSPHSVAEHTVALILTLNRKIHKAYLRTRDGNFSLDGLQGFDLYNKTAGIVGAGKIAQVLMKILKGFGMRVIAYDPYPNYDVAREIGFEFVDLDTIYRESDIISLNCPLTAETKYMINEDSMKLMKDGVMIVNTGRGALVDSIDLIEALKDKKVGAAALDVYEEEGDYFFEDFSADIVEDDILARLLSFNNVLITSHQAFFTREALEAIAMVTLENIAEYVRGDKLTNEVCSRCGNK
ncbi:lactate dehydrogenase [Propionigenium maris DSM 9537]|uniref:Lactate dehydrogenase n=1 Tax=Propionigenium maris DSM 9537 TaxID=1123000 RepID=A0A9W6GNA4_9FUSO|nr:2-hydroxyacid dehydrogenase [Propionigenium maris]GLI56939.1 lactate dehydrogenase [Propionigenium maris DSM 9537]